MSAAPCFGACHHPANWIYFTAIVIIDLNRSPDAGMKLIRELITRVRSEQPEPDRPQMFLAAFQDLWNPGMLGAFFFAIARNLAIDTARGHFSPRLFDPDRLVRYGYVALFTVYFFAAAVDNKIVNECAASKERDFADGCAQTMNATKAAADNKQEAKTQATKRANDL